MKILTDCNQAEIISELLNGKTVVFPTETTYGLGCDGTNRVAVENIFKIKGRRSDKPLLVIVANVEMAKKYLVWNDLAEKISNKYWPGAVTMVGEYRPQESGEADLAPGVVSAQNTVAIRVSSFSVIHSLSEMMGKPLVSTSANISDTEELYNPRDIMYSFSEREYQPDYVFDYGVLYRHAPTTIVSVVGGEMKILRQGDVLVKI